MPGAWRKTKRLLQNHHILLRLFQFCSQSLILGEQIRFAAAADGILQSGSLLFLPSAPATERILPGSLPPGRFRAADLICKFQRLLPFFCVSSSHVELSLELLF